MPALVAIEIAAPEPNPTQWVAPMLAACSAALRHGSCVYAVDEAPEVPRARVIWNGENAVTIEFLDERRGNSVPVRRELSFTDADAPEEKWKTVGFTAALLAGGSEQDVAPAAAPVPTADLPQSFRTALSGRLVAATGQTLQSPKGGIQLRFEGRAWQAPWLVGLSLEYSADPWKTAGVEGLTSWTEIGVGAALLSGAVGELELFTRFDVLARHLLVRGDKKDKSDSVSIWQPGARLGMDLAWPLSPVGTGVRHWWLVFGAHLSFVDSEVEVRIDGKSGVDVPPVSGGAGIGLAYRR